MIIDIPEELRMQQKKKMTRTYTHYFVDIKTKRFTVTLQSNTVCENPGVDRNGVTSLVMYVFFTSTHTTCNM